MYICVYVCANVKREGFNCSIGEPLHPSVDIETERINNGKRENFRRKWTAINQKEVVSSMPGACCGEVPELVACEMMDFPVHAKIWPGLLLSVFDELLFMIFFINEDFRIRRSLVSTKII